MMKLRKTLVTLLVVSMVIAGFTGVAGATFSDTKDNKAANKIEKLAALGVLAGYPDGTFKPDNNITRAEFSKIACVLAGLSSSGDILKSSPSKFSDVKAGEWYTGWVNLAVSQGYMKGYPDGTFKPQANVSNAEVLTVLCRIIGYNDNLPGEWPVEYLVKAADLKISKDLIFDGSAPATRGYVAWFSEQSLEVDNVEWDKDKEKFVKITPAETLLSENFEGAIKEDALCTGWEISADKQKVSFYLGDDNGGFVTTSNPSYVVAKDCVFNGVAHYSGLQNKIVDFILNEDNEIIYAEVKTYGSLSDTEAEKVSNTKFKISDKSYTVNAGALVNVKGKAVSAITGDWDQYADVANDVWDDGDGFQKVYALLNSDGEIAYVRSSEISDPAIVDSVSATTKKITLKENGNQSVTGYNNDVSKSTTEVIVFRDGKLASASDIQENDLLWVYAPSNGYDYKLDARSSKVTGKLEENAIAFNSFRIGGTSYDAWHASFGAGPTVRRVKVSINEGDDWANANQTDLDDMLGENVTALTDGNGYVRALLSSVESDAGAKYGIVAEVFGSTSSAGYTTTDIEIFEKDGSLHKYAVNSDSDGVAKAKQAKGVDPDAGGPLLSGDYIYFDVTAGGGFNGSDVWAHEKRMVKFTLQGNGAIKGFEFVSKAGNIAQDAQDTDLNTITVTGGAAGTYGVSQAIIFDVSSSDKDDWTVAAVSDFQDVIDVGAAVVVDLKADKGEVQYLSTSTAVSSGATWAMVMGRGYDADGKYIKMLNDAGSTVKKTAKSAVDISVLSKGDIISYTITGGEIATATKDAGTSAKIYDVQTKGTKRVAIGSSSTWYYVDDDSLFFNFTGDDPVKITINDLNDLDNCRFKLDAKNNIDWIVVVD